MGTSSAQKCRIRRELYRNAIHVLPESRYKADMLECCEEYDRWEIKPRTMAKVGRPRKAATKPAPKVKRRKAA